MGRRGKQTDFGSAAVMSTWWNISLWILWIGHCVSDVAADRRECLSPINGSW